MPRLDRAAPTYGARTVGGGAPASIARPQLPAGGSNLVRAAPIQPVLNSAALVEGGNGETAVATLLALQTIIETEISNIRASQAAAAGGTPSTLATPLRVRVRRPRPAAAAASSTSSDASSSINPSSTTSS